MTAGLAQLRSAGFSVVENVLSAPQLERVAAAYDRAFAEAAAPDLRTSRTGGDTRLVDLVNRGSEFDALYLLDPVLAACRDSIGSSYKLSAFGARTVWPGAPAQALHVDVTPHDDAWPLVGFIVMVDDFHCDNGATRFVSGSHAWETFALHEDQHRPDDAGHALACGAAGSVIVYLGSTWHGYSANRSHGPRRSIQGAYIPRGGSAAVDWASRMSGEALRRLSAEARYALALD